MIDMYGKSALSNRIELAEKLFNQYRIVGNESINNNNNQNVNSIQAACTTYTAMVNLYHKNANEMTKIQQLYNEVWDNKEDIGISISFINLMIDILDNSTLHYKNEMIEQLCHLCKEKDLPHN